jgi:hypothetical protein
MSVLGMLLALLILGGSAASIGSVTVDTQQAETKDRLTPEKLEQLVKEPIAVTETHGIQAGKKSFAKLLGEAKQRHGAGSIEVADLLTAFGVQLYTAGIISEDATLKRASLEYLEAAVAAYRSAFGSDHPEVAVALHSYANAQLGVYKEQPPASASRALEEVYRIRLKTFGSSNAETRAIRLELAALEGHPWRVKQDPSNLQRSNQLFEDLIAISPVGPAARDTSAPAIRLALARMYAKNGLVGEAIRNVRRAAEQMQSWPEEQRCVNITLALIQLQADLRDYGHMSAADRLADATGVTELLNCALRQPRIN